MVNDADSEDSTVKQSGPCWFIDLDWFPQHGRSFAAVVQNCLCPACRKQWAVVGEGSASKLLAVIKSCCAQQPGFITPELPVRQNIFRLLLSRGNQPLELELLAQQLNELYGVNKLSIEGLLRLLESDGFYGLCRAD